MSGRARNREIETRRGFGLSANQGIPRYWRRGAAGGPTAVPAWPMVATIGHPRIDPFATHRIGRNFAAQAADIHACEMGTSLQMVTEEIDPAAADPGDCVMKSSP